VAARGVCTQSRGTVRHRGGPFWLSRLHHDPSRLGLRALSDANWAVAPQRWQQQGQGSAEEGARVGRGRECVDDIKGA
jgi:hypothetical protein